LSFVSVLQFSWSTCRSPVARRLFVCAFYSIVYILRAHYPSISYSSVVRT
jgi:hypothetical protein